MVSQYSNLIFKILQRAHTDACENEEPIKSPKSARGKIAVVLVVKACFNPLKTPALHKETGNKMKQNYMKSNRDLWHI